MSSNYSSFFKFVCIFFFFLFLHVSESISINETTFRPMEDLKKMKTVYVHLKKLNKPPLKTIQSSDGDLIDCIVSHLQPAFDHPKLRGQRPLEPPTERPKAKGDNSTDIIFETMQLWTESNEFCPEGTIPIRRTTEKDVLRATSLRRFGRKIRGVRRDTSSGGHEHAVAFVNGGQYYGAKASMNVWTPAVTEPYEFSLSQIWVISGSFGNDLNTIEAGWQVSPELYGDGYPRFFTYWTTDAYRATGCYNLLCSGFVQTNNKIAIGAAISPRSSYNGKQFDIGIMIWKVVGFGFKASTLTMGWEAKSMCNMGACAGLTHQNTYMSTRVKRLYQLLYQNRTGNFLGAIEMLEEFDPIIKDHVRRITDDDIHDPKHGHWWLQYGSGVLIGYWPSFLFSHLQKQASMIQFGGEIVNSRRNGHHTTTQMGSGHFADEGFKKAAYFRNLQVVDWDNSLLPLTNLHLLADHSNCYDIKAGKNNVWGNYIYYGGPGRNAGCP